MAYLGLDIGTTGCKASLIDKNGDIVLHAGREYDLLFPGDGRIEISPETVWKSVYAVLYEIANTGNNTIDSISIASFGESFVLLDENDIPLANSIFYTDARGTEEIQDIVAAITEERLFHITGMPLNSIYSLNKLLWIKKHQPELLKKANKLFLYSDYIGYKLTGERYIDYSLASRTMMFDIRGKIWSEEIMDAFDLDCSMLSSPGQAGTKVGTIRHDMCRNLGFQYGTPLILGGHDQACAALGTGTIHDGDSCDSFGAAECITIVLSENHDVEAMKQNNYCCEPYLVADRYITLAFNTSAGASLKWYRDNIERERYMESSRQNRKCYAILDSECEVMPTSLLFLPYLNGKGTPSMDSLSAGGFLGITSATTKNELYKSVIEGICLDMKYNLDLLNAIGISVKKVCAVGGGALSETLLQIKADVFGIPVETPAVSESGTLGLAILAAVACGHYPDYAAAIRSMVVRKETFYPNNDNKQIYETKYLQFKKINSWINMLKI